MLLDKSTVFGNCTFPAGLYNSPQKVQKEGNYQVHDDRLGREWCARVPDYFPVGFILEVFVIFFHAAAAATTTTRHPGTVQLSSEGMVV